MADPAGQPLDVRHGESQRMPNRQQPGGRIVAQSVQYIGPTPPPEHIEAYHRMLPTAPERFLAIAEGEVIHRRGIENAQMELAKRTAADNASLARRGQACALLIAILGLSGSIWLGLRGAETTAGIVGGGSLATIILAFLRGTSSPGKAE